MLHTLIFSRGVCFAHNETVWESVVQTPVTPCINNKHRQVYSAEVRHDLLVSSCAIHVYVLISKLPK